jgi:hypothetical protein
MTEAIESGADSNASATNTFESVPKAIVFTPNSNAFLTGLVPFDAKLDEFVTKRNACPTDFIESAIRKGAFDGKKRFTHHSATPLEQNPGPLRDRLPSKQTRGPAF